MTLSLCHLLSVDNEAVQRSLLQLIGCILLLWNSLPTCRQDPSCFHLTANQLIFVSFSYQLLSVNIYDPYMFQRAENTWLSKKLTVHFPFMLIFSPLLFFSCSLWLRKEEFEESRMFFWNASYYKSHLKLEWIKLNLIVLSLWRNLVIAFAACSKKPKQNQWFRISDGRNLLV